MRFVAYDEPNQNPYLQFLSFSLDIVLNIWYLIPIRRQ